MFVNVIPSDANRSTLGVFDIRGPLITDVAVAEVIGEDQNQVGAIRGEGNVGEKGGEQNR